MIHIIVGNTGAGKTQYSKQLQTECNGVLFSIDEWNNTLFLPDKTQQDGLEWMLERIERIEQMIQNLLIQHNESNIETVLDLGFSKFIHREKFRLFAKSNGIKYKLHYIDTPKETRWERVLKRNKEQGETFQFIVKPEDFNFMESWFEAPNEEELKLAKIIRE